MFARPGGLDTREYIENVRRQNENSRGVSVSFFNLFSLHYQDILRYPGPLGEQQMNFGRGSTGVTNEQVSEESGWELPIRVRSSSSTQDPGVRILDP